MKRFIVGFIFFSIFIAQSAVAQRTAISDLQELAVVKLNKRESITLRQLKNRVESLQKQLGGVSISSAEDRQKILDAMIQEKLISQAAQKAGITVPDSQVDQMFLQQMSQIAGGNVTEQQFATIVREQLKMSLDDYMKEQTGMSVSEYKAYLKTQLIGQQYVISQRQSQLQQVAASDEQIRAFYELNKSSFVQNDMMRLFIVEVPKEKNAQNARTKATDLLNTYKNKRESAEQLIVRSRTNNSGFQAGEALINKSEQSAYQMGLSYQQLLQLFTHDVGWISEVQDNQDNYQFYSVTQKYDAKMLGLSDVVQPGTTVTVYDYIRQNLSQQQQTAYLQNAVNEIAQSLDKSENVDRKKTGKDLTNLLGW